MSNIEIMTDEEFKAARTKLDALRAELAARTQLADMDVRPTINQLPNEALAAHRADCFAAILDHRLGRAAEPRDQLSHRVRRGAQQPAPGRFLDAPPYGRCEARREKASALPLR
jgi:hypothetical protein